MGASVSFSSGDSVTSDFFSVQSFLSRVTMDTDEILLIIAPVPDIKTSFSEAIFHVWTQADAQISGKLLMRKKETMAGLIRLSTDRGPLRFVCCKRVDSTILG